MLILVIASIHGSMSPAYHPAVTTLSIDNPSRNLSGGLNDQQTAEALGKLEDGGAVSQRLVPSGDRGALQQPLTTEDPLMDRFKLRTAATKCLFRPAHVIRRVDGKLIQTPDQQGGYDEPLCAGDDVAQRPAKSGRLWCCQAQSREEEVIGAKRQREGEATGAAANVKGQRDGEDDGAEEGGRREHSAKPHLRAPSLPSSCNEPGRWALRERLRRGWSARRRGAVDERRHSKRIAVRERRETWRGAGSQAGRVVWSVLDSSIIVGGFECSRARLGAQALAQLRYVFYFSSRKITCER